MGPKSEGLINRDYNATLNMQEIVKTLVETKKRPICFEPTKKEQIKCKLVCSEKEQITRKQKGGIKTARTEKSAYGGVSQKVVHKVHDVLN